MNITNSFNNYSTAGMLKTAQNTQKPQKNEDGKKSEESGLSLALKPKFAHSREELLQNKIDDLREQLSALADAEELDDDTKNKMRKSINEQISELNVELMDLRKQRMEKEAEKAAESGDRSKKFDRYEPSEALKNMNKAASADTALEQAKIQNSTAGKLQSRQKIVKNELKADISTGAATEQKEKELVDLRSKIRNAGKSAGDSLKDAKDEEPTFVTFNTGLADIMELRERAKEQENNLGLSPHVNGTHHREGDIVYVDGKRLSAEEQQGIDFSAFKGIYYHPADGGERYVAEYSSLPQNGAIAGVPLSDINDRSGGVSIEALRAKPVTLEQD